MILLLLVLIIGIHFAVVISLILAFCILPFTQPLLLWIPINVCIARIATSNRVCILTEIENSLRIKVGMRPITGFIGHYLLKLPKLLLGKIRKQL